MAGGYDGEVREWQRPGAGESRYRGIIGLSQYLNVLSALDVGAREGNGKRGRSAVSRDTFHMAD